MTNLKKSKGKQNSSSKDTDSVGASTVPKNNLSQFDTGEALTACTSAGNKSKSSETEVDRGEHDNMTSNLNGENDMIIEEDAQVQSPKRQREKDVNQGSNRVHKSPMQTSRLSRTKSSTSHHSSAQVVNPTKVVHNVTPPKATLQTNNIVDITDENDN